MKGPFVYKVIYEDIDDDPRLDSGIGMCETYAEAAKIIENYFGPSLISIQHLELLEEGNLLPMPWNIIKKEILDTDFYAPRCDRNGNLLPEEDPAKIAEIPTVKEDYQNGDIVL